VPESPDPPSPADLGARQVRAVMVSVVGSVVLAALMGGTDLFGALFWIAGLAFLWLSMSKGRGWARWVVIGFITLLGVGNAVHAVELLGGETLAFVLVMSPKVTAYLADRREARTPTPPPR